VARSSSRSPEGRASSNTRSPALLRLGAFAESFFAIVLESGQPWFIGSFNTRNRVSLRRSAFGEILSAISWSLVDRGSFSSRNRMLCGLRVVG